MKTWQADDVEMGASMTIEKVAVSTENEAPLVYIKVIRPYRFVDSDQKIISDIAVHWVNESMATADVPDEILTAIKKIDVFTYEKAKAQEGI